MTISLINLSGIVASPSGPRASLTFCHVPSSDRMAPPNFLGDGMEGFYVTYVTARAGTAIILWVIRGTTMVGVDAGGLKYDGELTQTQNGFRCSIVYLIPPHASLITGTPTSPNAQRIPLEFDLPADFANGQVVSILTPLGPINAKFQKLRDL